MPVHNTQIAHLFEQYADLLEIDGANCFRVGAYRDAVDIVNQYPRSLADMLAEGEDLTEIHGIGPDLSAKITEIVNTGQMGALEELKERIPIGLTDLMNVPGLGPKRVKLIYEELGISSREGLLEAAKTGRLQQVKGLSAKFESELLKKLERFQDEDRRLSISSAETIASALVAYLQESGVVNQIAVAGSFRRRRETVGDLDILVTSDAGDQVIDHFVHYGGVAEIRSQGDERSTVVLHAGLQVDVRVVPPESFGAALLYFTGSKPHNLALRNIALDRDLKINEYGIFRGEERLGGATEEEMYAALDLRYIPPELRENRGEIEAAAEGRLPNLLTLENIRGNLHAHTTESDGHASLEEMANAAKKYGYDYAAVTDHSPVLAMTNGLSAERLARQIEDIDRLNEQLDGVRLLKGIEVDILQDGSLDLPDLILARLDLRICSIHTHFNLSEEQQTERIIRAMDNPHFNILGHPTGRLLGKRPPYEVNVERLLEAALERGCFLELNANPERLDLNDVYLKAAKEMGLKISIATDAHYLASFEYMRYGVDQARRGWLEADDVLNTRSWADLAPLFRR